ncbi:unnamed protein product [Boreogadus saida]
MSRKKLAWANKEVETFVCILGEEDVVYDVYVAAAAIDIRPTTKDDDGGGTGAGPRISPITQTLRLPATPADPLPSMRRGAAVRLHRDSVNEFTVGAPEAPGAIQAYLGTEYGLVSLNEGPLEGPDLIWLENIE